MMWHDILWGFLMVWNLLTFFLYGWDKLCAKQRWRRIPESVLIMVAFLMGAVGAMFGMVVWNHKTSKPKFRSLVPLSVLFNAACLWLLLGV